MTFKAVARALSIATLALYSTFCTIRPVMNHPVTELPSKCPADLPALEFWD